MKITNRQLKRIIKEEYQKVLNEGGSAPWSPGDYLEVGISDDGYDTVVKKIDPSLYENKRSYVYSFKALVRIEQVADIDEEY